MRARGRGGGVADADADVDADADADGDADADTDADTGVACTSLDCSDGDCTLDLADRAPKLARLHGALADWIDYLFFTPLDADGEYSAREDSGDALTYEIELAEGVYDVSARAEGGAYSYHIPLASAITVSGDAEVDFGGDVVPVVVRGTIEVPESWSSYLWASPDDLGLDVRFTRDGTGEEASFGVDSRTGEWVARVEPGTWALAVVAGRFFRTFQLDVGTRTFTADEEVDIALPELVGVRVSVTWEDEPVPDGELRIASADGSAYAEVPWDESESEFEIFLPAGEWEVDSAGLLGPLSVDIRDGSELAIAAEHVRVTPVMVDLAGVVPGDASPTFYFDPLGDRGDAFELDDGAYAVLPGRYDVGAYVNPEEYSATKAKVASDYAVTDGGELRFETRWGSVSGMADGYYYFSAWPDGSAMYGDEYFWDLLDEDSGFRLIAPEGTWHLGLGGEDCTSFLATVEVTGATEVEVSRETVRVEGTAPEDATSSLAFERLSVFRGSTCEASAADGGYSVDLVPGDYSVVHQTWIDGSNNSTTTLAECVTVVGP